MLCRGRVAPCWPVLHGHRGGSRSRSELGGCPKWSGGRGGIPYAVGVDRRIPCGPIGLERSPRSRTGGRWMLGKASGIARPPPGDLPLMARSAVGLISRAGAVRSRGGMMGPGYRASVGVSLQPCAPCRDRVTRSTRPSPVFGRAGEGQGRWRGARGMRCSEGEAVAGTGRIAQRSTRGFETLVYSVCVRTTYGWATTSVNRKGK
ncbi:hypothetical protein CALVIDRAFT_83574 [Calocera viscosa TUFC12733]|uniref:Uncharacterized protein n=1 Tax=Calocera viscosa (strain TUFC12733) TaxID=1330018 RepID=A0A167N3U9_CALVF|nr:hypothetical protein CALVIDRAFT_83574 [Calocera viscosa TUFC12733]